MRRLVIAILFWSWLPVAQGADSREMVDDARSKPLVRGGIVFKTYCALCHGERGDGQGRAAKLHRELPLAIQPGSVSYYQNIIQQGGASLGKSAFMPPWENELSIEQTSDVVAYLSVINNPLSRGKVVFNANCILCHGVRGDGKGRAAAFFNPPPADLTRSDKNDDYKRLIITLGGAALGRSSVMPIWGEQLTTQEIDDVVAYLGTLLWAKEPNNRF